MEPADDRHRSPWSRREKVLRVLWSVVQATVFRHSPHPLYRWRAWLLRRFGATLGTNVRVRPSVRITIPWNLTLGDETSVGDDAILYALGRITTGRFVTVSQYAHLCAGSHDAGDRRMALLRLPITLGDDVWVAADAFVGPDVAVGDRALIGARASVFKDVPADVVVGGNPAKVLKPREWREPPGRE